jgi:hypothetical protein
MRIRPLKPEVQRYVLLRQRLIEAFPRIDNETLHDTLEGITTLQELIAETIRSALIDESFRTGLSQRLDDMRERASRLELRAAKKREWVLEAMREAGLRKLEQADFTAFVRTGVPSLVIAAEGEIPPEYWIPQAPKLARQALLRALKQGDEVPGAYLSNAKPNLSVRTK